MNRPDGGLTGGSPCGLALVFGGMALVDMMLLIEVRPSRA
jgi:hypothetical protein